MAARARKMAAPVLLILIAAATSGCVTTLGELRQANPDRTGRAVGDYQALGGCVTEGLQTSGNLLYQTIVRPDQKRMVVTAFMTGRATSQAPLIDLTFRQVDAQNVAIESRWAGVFTSRKAAERIDAQMWPIARRCVGGRLDEVSPPAP
jgi:hypothetical protein